MDCKKVSIMYSLLCREQLFYIVYLMFFLQMWSMPGIQPRLLPRDTPLSLVKEVPSVFAPTAVDEVMEVDVEGEAGEGVDDSGSLLEEEEEQLKLSFSAQLKVLYRVHSINHTI